MLKIFGALVGLLFLARVYVDFITTKPSAWTSRERGFWISTIAFAALILYVGITDARGQSGSAYFLMFVAVPGWLMLVTGFGLRAVQQLFGTAR